MSDFLDAEAFKVYHWLCNCKYQGISIARNNEYWLQLATTQELEVASYSVLKLFRKPKVTPVYRPVIQKELNYLIAQQKEHSNLPEGSRE